MSDAHRMTIVRSLRRPRGPAPRRPAARGIHRSRSRGEAPMPRFAGILLAVLVAAGPASGQSSGPPGGSSGGQSSGPAGGMVVGQPILFTASASVPDNSGVSILTGPTALVGPSQDDVNALKAAFPGWQFWMG